MSLGSALLLRVVLAGAIAAAPADPPRVLVLGDGAHGQALQAARTELAGRVELVLSGRVLATHTGTALEHFEELWAGGEWDLVYFNWGLGDLVHRDPSTSEERVLARDAGGVRTSSPGRYRENLEQLVERMSADGTPLLFATTTPTQTLKSGHTPLDQLFDAGAELEYNRIATNIMRAREVAVLDLHAFCVQQFEGETHPPFLDYARALSRDEDKPDLHVPVVRAILEELGLEGPAEEPAAPADGPP